MGKRGFLSDEYPLLCQEWDYERNAPLLPSQVTSGSRMMVWWCCSNCKGEYRAAVYNRTSGSACPYCSGKRVLKGYNDIETVCPDLCLEWDYQRNDAKPGEITYGSGRRWWWICKEGHSYQSRISDRRKGNGCPYCSHRRLLQGFNDLQTLNPMLAAEWDYELNGELTPMNVTPGMTTRVWWKCGKCGHIWRATIGSRSNGSGCPVCMKAVQAENRVASMLRHGRNSLEAVYPSLAAEWHPTKNGDLLPSMITRSSNAKVWWKCNRCGYEWEATVNYRSRRKGCPRCSVRNTSFAEQAVFFYVSRYYPNAINRDRSLGFEIDVYIPDEKVAIEYDGVYFHGNDRDGMGDDTKDNKCKEFGITLIRIREEGLPPTAGAKCIFRKGDTNEALNDCIASVLSSLEVEGFDRPDVERDIAEIQSLYTETYKNRSFAESCPEIVKEWDVIKNGNLTPWQVTSHSEKKVWWICPQNHSYLMRTAHRANGGGCPICARIIVGQINQKKRLQVGVNDLGTTFPLIASEWDFNKNEDLPTDFLPGSNMRRYWKCRVCGNEWCTSIANRTAGKGCPKCGHERMSRKQSKRVKCIETSQIFDSLREAAEACSVSRSLIGLCANGKIKTAAGYHWEYV